MMDVNVYDVIALCESDTIDDPPEMKGFTPFCDKEKGVKRLVVYIKNNLKPHASIYTQNNNGILSASRTSPFRCIRPRVRI